MSSQEFDHIEEATRASQAEVQAAQAAVETAKLNLEWTQVHRRLTGSPDSRPVQVGDLVTPATLLTAVSQVNPIKVNFPISEQEYLRASDRIKEHQATGRPRVSRTSSSSSAMEAFTNIPVTSIAWTARSTSRPAPSRFRDSSPIPTPVLRPGQYAKVRAATKTRRGALMVPQRAVQETQGQYQVAVVGADNTVAMRTVKPGDRVGDLWIITDGVNPGERVITEGLQKVKDGVEVIAQPDPATYASAPALPPPAPNPAGSLQAPGLN